MTNKEKIEKLLSSYVPSEKIDEVTQDKICIRCQKEPAYKNHVYGKNCLRHINKARKEKKQAYTGNVFYLK